MKKNTMNNNKNNKNNKVLLLLASPLSKKLLDGTKARKVKTSHLLSIDEHDFTMRPAFAGKTALLGNKSGGWEGG